MIEYDSQDTTRFTNIDIHGNAMRNTAGDQYAGQEINATNWVISVQKNVARVPKWLLRYDNNPINSDTVTIEGLTYPKKTLQLHGLRIPKATKENDVRFFDLSYTLHYDSATWDLNLLNEGFFEIAATGVIGGVAFTEKTRVAVRGEPTPEPVLLGKDGSQFTDDDGNVRTDVKDSEIIINSFDVYKELPFSILPLK